jgi:hypothetical protein
MGLFSEIYVQKVWTYFLSTEGCTMRVKALVVERKWLWIFLLANILDQILTWVILSQGGSEANPLLSRYWFAKWLMVGLVMLSALRWERVKSLVKPLSIGLCVVVAWNMAAAVIV